MHWDFLRKNQIRNSFWGCMSVFMQLHRQEYFWLGERFVTLSQETILMLTSKIGVFKVLITFIQNERNWSTCLYLSETGLILLWLLRCEISNCQFVRNKNFLFGSFSLETLSDVWCYFFLGIFLGLYHVDTLIGSSDFICCGTSEQIFLHLFKLLKLMSIHVLKYTYCGF